MQPMRIEAATCVVGGWAKDVRFADLCTNGPSHHQLSLQPIKLELLDLSRGLIARARTIAIIVIAHLYVTYIVAEPITPIEVEATRHAAASTVARIIPTLRCVAASVAHGAIPDKQWVA